MYQAEITIWGVGEAVEFRIRQGATGELHKGWAETYEDAMDAVEYWVDQRQLDDHCRRIALAEFERLLDGYLSDSGKVIRNASTVNLRTPFGLIMQPKS